MGGKVQLGRLGLDVLDTLKALGDYLTTTEIVEDLGKPKNNVRATLRRLERNGWVSRKRDLTYKSRFLWSLTPEGKAEHKIALLSGRIPGVTCRKACGCIVEPASQRKLCPEHRREGGV